MFVFDALNLDSTVTSLVITIEYELAFMSELSYIKKALNLREEPFLNM